MIHGPQAEARAARLTDARQGQKAVKPPPGSGAGSLDLPDLHRHVDELIVKALSDEVYLDAISPVEGLDQTGRVQIYVQRELGTLGDMSQMPDVF